jgi:putative transposase
MPHHITQRGNRRQQTFVNENDYAACIVEIWACCLVPNHGNLNAVPKTDDALRRAIGEAHRRYTRRIDFREKWRG